MGSYEEMKRRVEEKVKAGFKCIKLKIGAIDWDKELSLISALRKDYSPEQLTIRVDANGAFSMENVFLRLKQLADLGVHSIEQPIPQGFPDLR